MPFMSAAVTFIAAFVALVLAAHFFAWMLSLASAHRHVPRVGLGCAGVAFLVVSGWVFAVHGGEVYTWGGNRVTALIITIVFGCAGLFCVWHACRRANQEAIEPA